MLDLTNLRSLLAQVISLPSLHTAVLFTPEGQLVSYVADPRRPKDEVRVVVGVSGEVWQETRKEGIGMITSELGRVLVLPVEKISKDKAEAESEDPEDPLMLLALNADESVEWDELEDKARTLVMHLEQPVEKLRNKLASAPTSPISARPERAAR